MICTLLAALLAASTAADGKAAPQAAPDAKPAPQAAPSTATPPSTEPEAATEHTTTTSESSTPAAPEKAPALPRAEGAPLRLAVPDPLGLERAKKDAAAIAAILAKKLGQPVEGRAVAAAELARLLADGEVDLGWLSALAYVDAAKVARIQPLARLVRGGLPFYRSVIFTRAGKPQHSLADLKGKKVALVAKYSATGHMLPSAMLREVAVEETLLLRDHAAVCKAVLDGKADAGATFGNDREGKTVIAGCAESVGERVKELQVLAASEPIPNDVLAAREGLAASDVEPLRLALVSLGESAEGKALLEGAFHAEAFLPCEDADFAMLRETLAGR